MNEETNGREIRTEKLTQTQEERNNNILRAWLPVWVTNSHLNHAQIVREFQYEDMSLANMPRPAEGNGPAVIVGSGPSLDRTAPMLRNWKGAVFCAGSNAKVAARWGHQPEFVVVFDANEKVLDQLKGWRWKGSTLITNPAVSPNLLKFWRWKRRYYLMLHPGIDWFMKIQPMAYCDHPQYASVGIKAPDIRIAVLNAGCTVVNAIQIAHFLKYDPLFLVGVDFGYPNGDHRCTGWEYVAGKWEPQAPPPNPQWIHECKRHLHKSDNGVLTTEEQIDYKVALMAVWKLDKPALFDCSDGIISEIPKLDFQEVVERDGQGFEGLPEDEVTRRANDVLDRLQGISDEGNVDREDETVRGEPVHEMAGSGGGDGGGGEQREPERDS